MPKIAHTELISNNPKLTADFVEKMFGWKIQKWDNPKAEYYMWNYPGEEKMAGGGIGQAEKQGPRIDIYVDVDDINATIEKAGTYGAKAVTGETEIGGGMGYFAVLQIPGGVNIGIWAKNPSKHPAPKQTVSQNR